MIFYMRILIACEESQTVCKALREKGHEAFSCDTLPCSGGHPEWHIQGDVLNYLEGRPVFTPMGMRIEPWDMMIAHPPCTHLAVSGAAWFKEKIADGRQQEAIDFFMALVNAPIEMIAVENPVCIMSTKYRKPDQIIQPWMFGHKETKATCLWLKNLPKLNEEDNVKEAMLLLPKKEQQRMHYLPPSPDRAKIRSKTYQGVANAIAEQWG